MKIRFLKVTNIRSDHQSLRIAPIGKIYENTVLEVAEELHLGANFHGDNRWWRDHNGWYYWAGATELVLSEPTPDPVVVGTDETPTPAPVAAVELVLLPTPVNEPISSKHIPEGEWRALPNLASILSEQP